jgi:phage shock protein A
MEDAGLVIEAELLRGNPYRISGGHMAELKLISPRQRQLKHLVEAALHNELRLLEAGIRRTEQRIQEFETRHALSSAEFVNRYEQDELKETLEFVEWIGEYRLLERLREKADILREIQFAD